MIDMILHLNVHLGHLVTTFGSWTYVILFLIVFSETGLIILPFLPGDSLLFAVGALAAVEESHLSLGVILVTLSLAAIVGDAVNYAFGSYLGAQLLQRRPRWLNFAHIQRTQEFYGRHGGKTIVLARFVPIVRTFAPFVAGLAKMPYSQFALFNVAGALVWVVAITVAGYWFGNLPSVQSNFHIVIAAIIVISLLPIMIEYIRAKRAAA